MPRLILRSTHSSAREPRQSPGFTLVEMMVALVAGLLVSLAVVTFMMSSMKSNGDYVSSTRLTQELRNTLDIVVRDLSRAGYNDDALAYVSLPSTSPFAPVFIQDLNSTVHAGTPSTYVNADNDGCVIYSYDRTYPNGTTDVPDFNSSVNTFRPGKIDLVNGEIRGIRRKVTNGVGVIEYAESANGVTPACGGAAVNYSTNPSTCSSNGWCALSDPTRIDITRFVLIDKGSNITTSMRVRNLGVLIEGRPVGTTDYTRAVYSDIKIHADCIATAVASCTTAPVP